MPRRRRVVIPQFPHHVTQRGNNRRDVFYADSDREVYLNLLRKYCAEFRVDVLGYCLLTNHIHALVVPASASGLAKAFGRTHNDYARWLHIRRRESGHLWQNRFYSCPVEKCYLWAVLAYIERNPVRAGLAVQCQDWRWSSASTHLDLAEHAEWLELDLWAENWTSAQWQVALKEGLAEEQWGRRLQEATSAGRPFGESTFIEACEQHSGLHLSPQRPGPKPRVGTNDRCDQACTSIQASC